ncbi:undecaprenyl-phosphate glucose phosphotransferase [Algibacillus agarilyticus]|uniref:undecaprenyl-phosphate glucose phosphotransferase n=1 Tax=Algibacillus agarilyticus TaxID=2234133 RepID=UPI000DCF7896|nr:undecaprenyl-phosphate glucose phosphotransferase [Algibacillus agarilyticus]
MANGFVKNNINQFSVIYRFVDFLLIQFFLVLCAITYSVVLNNDYFVLSLIGSTFFFLAAESLRLYRSWRSGFASRLALYTLISWFVACFCVSMFIFFSKSGEDLSRIVIGSWFVLSSLALVGWRMVFRAILFNLRKNGKNTKTVAILGVTSAGTNLAEQIFEHPETGFRLVGFFDDRQNARLPATYLEFLKGSVEEGVQRAKNGEFDAVYIALPLAAQKRIAEILRLLGDTTVDVHVVPDFFMFNLINSSLSHVGEMQTLSVYESPLSGPAYALKRIEDVIGSLLILSLIAIPMMIIAILIKLDSKGPILFKQKRYGIDGREIKVYKFRSMKVMDNGAVVKQAIKDDPRITKLGAFLRRSSLDELPQFVNVLQGKMSIVGPRPHAVAHNEEYRKLVDFYMLRHKVKPGITGWAQINGWRGETDTLDKMEKRIEFDLEYIRRWSIFFDIKIIFLTVFKGFVGKNVY